MNYKLLLIALLPYITLTMEIEQKQDAPIIRHTTITTSEREKRKWLSDTKVLIVDPLTNFIVDPLTNMDNASQIKHVKKMLKMPIAKHAINYSCTMSGNNLLMEACRSNLHEEYQLMQIVESLLNAGANINLFSTNYSDTALHIAINQNKIQIANFLIGHGANVNAQDCDLMTPLHYFKSSQAAILLLKNSAALEVRNTFNRTPLLNFIKKYRKNINTTINSISTKMSPYEFLDIISIFISYKADINAKTKPNGKNAYQKIQKFKDANKELFI